jgi:threonine dehydratase
MTIPREVFKVKVAEAYRRLGRDIKRTSLEFSKPLSRLSGAQVYVKWESDQITGSFKIRGALNRLRTLSPGEKSKGVVTASTGNHGLAMARAGRKEGLEVEVFVPASASRAKLRRLRSAGVNLRLEDAPCDKVESLARRAALVSGRFYVSPYNDLEVIFGQGTVGLEVSEQLAEAEDVLVPVGGGGLAAGIAGYLKSLGLRARIIGVEPEGSAFMAASFRAGRLVEIIERKTAAEAVAGGIEEGSVTFPLCRMYLDRILVVEEKILTRAWRELQHVHGRPVEGAGALALAAVLQHGDMFRGRKAVLIVSGGNISTNKLEEE